MSMRPLVRTAAVLLLAGACSAGLAYAAPLAAPSSPAAPSSCSALPFLLATPLTPAPLPASPAVCACGDVACHGHIAGTTCGSSIRVCVATGSCPTSAAKSCACVTKDPP